MGFAVEGFLTGILGGLFGVGGGEIFMPLLVSVFGFSQHQARGTSLAVLLPPIGLLAALRSYHAGHAQARVAASLGAVAATRIPGNLLRKLFGGFLLLVALHMIFGHHGR